MAPIDRRLVTAAEAALGRGWGAPVRLREAERFREGRVARFTVEGGPADADHVIVKVPEADAHGPQGLDAVHNEIAALQLLGRVAPGIVPALLAADATLGVVVLEDLGDGDSLASSLCDDDPAAATEAAVRSARGLGDLHARTVGRAHEHARLRAGLGPADPDRDLVTMRGMPMPTRVAELPALLQAHALPALPTGAASELAGAVAELAAPGDFAVLSSGDPCPDNERHLPDGVRFIDFEAAAVHHALVDAAHHRVPFPNCWCWRRLPTEVSSAMEDAYRAALATTCAAAADDERYERALGQMVALWVVWTLHRRLRDESDPWAQQRIVTTLLSIPGGRDRGSHLPEMATWATTAAEGLLDRWDDCRAVAPTYPAYGGPPLDPPR